MIKHYTLRLESVKRLYLGIPLFLVLILFANSTNAQVDVTATGGTLTASYATLKTAFDSINAGAHTGVISIGISASTTETASAVLNASGTGSANYSGITINPTGGGARTISGAITAGFPLIDLNGADNVVIDGLNSGGNSLLIVNTTSNNAASTSTIRFQNDATSNTVTNCSVNGASRAPGNSLGGNIIFGSGISTGNDNNTISFCNIGPVSTSSLPNRGIYALSSASAEAAMNSGIQILNNNIYDFFNDQAASNGVGVFGGNTQWTISNNRFYQTETRTQVVAGTLHAPIQCASGTLSYYVIENNIIGYASSTGTGVYTFVPVTNTSRFLPIFLSGLSTTIATTVNNNTITAISAVGPWAGNGSNPPFAGIFAAGLANVTNNTIGGSTSPTHIFLNSTIGAAGQTEFDGIYHFGAGSVTGNFIGGITGKNDATGATKLTALCGIRWQGNGIQVISNNTIGYAAAPLTLDAPGHVGGQLAGIRNDQSPAFISGNTVRYLFTNINNTSGGVDASIIGIAVRATTVNNNIVRSNQVYALTNTNTTTFTPAAGCHVYGISYSGLALSTALSSIDNNLVYALTSSGANPLASTIGINTVEGGLRISNNMIALGYTITGAVANQVGQYYGIAEAGSASNFPQVNMYHNSVYIGGTSTSGNANSIAFRSQTLSVSPRNFKNNIFANFRTNSGGTGKHYAVNVTGTAANPTGLSMNFNLLYSASNIIGLFSGTDRITLAAWQTATGQDVNSFAGDPQYLNPAVAVPDLHINNLVMSMAEGTGVPLSEITDDYDGQTRNSFTPVDIGADAFNGISAAPSFSNLTITPLAPQCVATSRTINVDIASVNGAILTSVLNYAFNGVSQSPVNMTFVSGTTYTATIPAATPSNAIVTWNVTASNAGGNSNVKFGTTYQDNYLQGHITTITATPPTYCNGGSADLKVSSLVGTPGQVSVGVYSGIQTLGGNPLKTNSSTTATKTQLLYTVAELQSAGMIPGTISSLSFYTPASSGTISNPSIKMGNTSVTSLSAIFTNIPMTTVFSQASFVIAAGPATVTFTFATPFTWDGSSNILIEFCQTNTAFSGGLFCSTMPFNGSCQVDGAGACGLPVGTPSNFRPLITFGATTGTVFTPGMNWVWTPGGATGTQITVNPTVTTPYTVTGTDANGCSVTSTVATLTVNDYAAAPTSAGSTQCGAGIPHAKVSSTTAGVNYKWYLIPTGGTPVQNSTVDSLSSYQITTTTTFYVSAVVGASGCESSRTAVVATVNQPDSVYATVSAGPYCPGVTVTLTAIQVGSTQNYTYTWNGNNLNTTTGSTVTASPTGAGLKTYTVTATDNQCTYINTVTVNLSASPVISSLTASPATICAFQPSILTALSIASRPDTASISFPASGNTLSSAGNPYRTNLGGNQDAKTQFLILASELTAAGFAPGNLTQLGFNVTTALGTVTNLTIKIKATTLTSMTALFETGLTTVVSLPSYTMVLGKDMHTFSTPFNWDGVSNLVIETCLTNDVGATSTILAATSTTNLCFATAGVGFCSSQTGVVVTSRPIVTFKGQKFKAVPDELTYVWSTPGGTVGSTSPLIVTPDATTTYTVVGTSSAGCTVTNTVPVTVQPVYSAPTVVPNTRCGFGLANVKAISTSGQAVPVYSWYDVATGGGAIQTGTADSLINYNVSTTKTFYVGEVTTTTGCLSQRTAVVQTVLPADSVYVTASDSFLCPGETATLTANKNGIQNNYTYSWVVSPPQGSGISGLLMTAPTTVINTDFNVTVLPANATLSGSAVYFDNSYIRLTPATTAQSGALTINGNGSNVDSLSTSFSLIVPTSPGNEGISYSFADDGSATGTTPNFEYGTGTKLAISFDAATAGTNTNGIYLQYVPANSPSTTINSVVLAYSNVVTWRGSATPQPVTITIDRNGKLTLSVNNVVIFNNIQLPNAYINANKSTWKHYFKARTNTIATQFGIDNLNIQTAYLTSGAVSGNPIVANPTAPGTYTFQVVGQDGGCAYTNSIAITKFPNPPSISAGADQLICQGTTVNLGAYGGGLIPPIRLTEALTGYKQNIGQPASVPPAVEAWLGAGNITRDLMEVTNLSMFPADIGGVSFEYWTTSSTTAPQGNTIVPAGAVLQPGANAFFNWIAPATSDMVNNIYSAGLGGDVGANVSYGIVIRKGTVIIDAIGFNGYTFPAGANVTTADWSGGSFVSNSGYCGNVLVGPDMNSTTNWSVTNPPIFGTPGILNAGLSLNLQATGPVNWTSIPSGFTASTPQASFGPILGTTLFATTYSNGQCETKDTVTVSVFTSPTAPQIVVEPDTVCVSGQSLLTVSNVTSGLNYVWLSSASPTGPWTPIPGGASTSFTSPVWSSVLGDSTIYIRAVSSCGIVSDSSATRLFYISNPKLLSASGATRCGVGTVTLNAATSGDNVVRWYTDSIAGTLLATGNSYTTLPVSSTKRYWVESRSNVGTDQVSSNGVPSTLAANIQASGVIFTLFKDVILNSFQVYSSGIGTATAILLDAGNNVVYVSPAIPINALGNTVPQTLPLGWSIPAGSSYKLIVNFTGGALHYHGAGSAFPYPMGNNVGVITTGYSTGVSSPNNYYVYNMNTTSGCGSQRIPVTVTVTPAPAITATVSSNAVCIGSSLTLDASSANPGYSFTWNGIQGAHQVVTPSASATYTVVATDTTSGPDAGCANTASFNVQVNPLPLTPSFTQTPVVACDGASVTLSAASDQPYTGQIGTGTTVISTAGQSPFSSNQEGSKIQYIYLKSELVAAGIVPGPLTALAWKVISAVTTSPMSQYEIKLGQTTTPILVAPYSGLTSVYSTAQYTPQNGWNTFNFNTPFIWDGTSNLVVEVCHNNDPTGTVVNATASASTVEATITTSAALYGQVGNNVTGLNPWDPCTVIANATTQQAAIHPNIRLTVGTENTFLWSTGATDDTTTVIPPLGSSSYTVTATNYYGCTSSNTHTIISSATPSPILTPGDTTICFGTIIKLAVRDTGAYSAGYPLGTTVDWIGIVNGLTPGDSMPSDNGQFYQVRVTLPSGCQALSSVRSVVTRAVSTFQTIVSPACGASNGAITVNVTDGVAPFRFLWKDANTSTVLLDTTMSNPTSVLSSLGAGNYTLEVVDSFPYGCSSGIIPYTLVSTAPPTVTVVPTSLFCFGDMNASAVATGTGGAGALTYLWDDSSVSPTRNNLGAGTYTVTVTDASGCSGSNSFTITQPAQIVATVTVVNPSCNGGTDGSLTANITGGTLPFSNSEWYDDAANPNQVSAGPVAIGLAAGNYQLLVSDANACSILPMYTLTNPAALAVTSFTPPSGPAGTVVTITGVSFTGTTNVIFNTTNAVTFSVVDDNTITATVPAGATTGLITIMTGCDTLSSATDFTVTAPTTATFNLHVLIEGYYAGAGQMTPVLNNIDGITSATLCDTIVVELHDALSPATVINTQKVVLSVSGQVSIQLPGSVIGNSYYIALFNRGTIETWSKLPVSFTSTTSYDFTTGSGQAFDDGFNPPMKQVSAGVWALYSGDTNQDGTVDGLDMNSVENDANAFAFGYNASDVSGDGATDGLDMNLVENNSNLFLFEVKP